MRKIVICMALLGIVLIAYSFNACTQTPSGEAPAPPSIQEQPENPSSQPQSTTEPPANLPSKTLKVSGSAMELTLHDGDKVDAFSVYRELERGDIVIFTSPADNKTMMIKRIIGLPGETIQIENGRVLINGAVYEESYIKGPFGYSYSPEVIPDNYYYVLGDNRANSSDSHNFGPVPLENILSITYLK